MPTQTQQSTPIATLADALADLGVTSDSLTDAEKAQFDRDGYFVFTSLLSRELVAEMARTLDRIAGTEGEKAGSDFHTEVGTTRLGNLMNKDPIFDILFTHPKILAALNYATNGNFGVSSLTGRAALPGEGAQGMHVDFGVMVDGVWKPAPGRAANVLVACDDFTQSNGATRLVPGTHRSGLAPGDAMNPDEAHPDERLLIVPAGSVAVIDGATWHGGTRNNTQQARHLVSAMCQPRGEYQNWAYRKITPQTAARLSPAQLYVLDHEVG